MSVYCDSSALVKLYADEHGSEVMRPLADPLLISQLARVEVPAALWRKQRAGELAPEHARTLAREFEADIKDDAFIVARVSADTTALAAELVADYPLRAYDAVQLASALVAQRALETLDGFACFDEQLRAAAGAEGLTLVPATLHG